MGEITGGARGTRLRSSRLLTEMTPDHTLKLLQASCDLIEKDQRIADLERQILSLKRLLGLRRLAEDLKMDAVNAAASGE
jgi:hypothetical protein